MLSRFLGQGDKPGGSPKTEVPDSSGLEVNEGDPESSWNLWDSALAEQDSQFSAQPLDASSDDEVPTQPMGLEPQTPEHRKDEALAIVDLHHHRIANTIRTLWGYKECGGYINQLIMSGGDGMGHARVGFNQEAVTAMMALSDLHEAQFGAGDLGTGTGFDGRAAFAPPGTFR